MISRRTLLATTTLAFVNVPALGRSITSTLPWQANAGAPPIPVMPGPWLYFTLDEGLAMEAIVDRFIPADPETPGGKDVGCAVYIDRQLAGPFGRAEGLYMQAPFIKGPATQGNQSDLTPAALYRKGLAALDQYCKATYSGVGFARLTDDQKDAVLKAMEKGEPQGQPAWDGVESKAFFTQMLTNTKEGFFADPLYGGNRGMAAWKMIGFPGARYDYRDWIDRHNERYPLPPVGIYGRSEWTVAGRP